jgi:septal ring factor EnvC (AmiA/AmiB activator)
MSSEELVRSELHERLTDVVGPHPAAYLMARVPPMEWDKVATKEDVHAARAEIADEIHEVRGEIAEVRSEVAEVRREVAEVRTELKAEIHDLRKDTVHEFAMVRTEMASLKHELQGSFRAELTAALGQQARILVVQHVLLFLAFAGFALATR